MNLDNYFKNRPEPLPTWAVWIIVIFILLTLYYQPELMKAVGQRYFGD